MTSILHRLRNRRANPAADPEAVTAAKSASDAAVRIPRTRVAPGWAVR